MNNKKAFLMYTYMQRNRLGLVWTKDGNIITKEEVQKILNRFKKQPCTHTIKKTDKNI